MGKGSCFSPFFFTAGTPREQSRDYASTEPGFLVGRACVPTQRRLIRQLETVDPSTLPTASGPTPPDKIRKV
ncbi:hypothetical protein ACIXGS_04135 [Bacteroides fragilis]|nr:hypothetical protein M067_0450 [Bacteroides fragilis str. J-143-4]EXZ90897.1 hypothetical protein M068_0447 [Bacteroides fragilis str. J38-1]MCD8060405.1 hypothetical protein [Bacteroides fragilis]